MRGQEEQGNRAPRMATRRRPCTAHFDWHEAATRTGGTRPRLAEGAQAATRSGGTSREMHLNPAMSPPYPHGKEGPMCLNLVCHQLTQVE
jgi:hypothetical protein